MVDGIWPATPGGAKAAHGTHVASLIFGQHSGPIQGIAPECRGLNLPAFSDVTRRSSQLEIARGIEFAVEAGAHVINVSGGQLSPSAEPEDALGRALGYCEENNVLVVAAVGNNGCFCNHVPAGVQSVLAVGALNDDGLPMQVSNWGPAYRDHGILAPGENMLGATPAGGTVRLSGSSMAAPIVSGVAALLLSLEVAAGRKPDPMGVGSLLVSAADRCEVEESGTQPDGTGYCDRFLSGILNVERAVRVMTQKLENETPSTGSCGCGTGVAVSASEAEVVTIAGTRAMQSPTPPPGARAPMAPGGALQAPAQVTSVLQSSAVSRSAVAGGAELSADLGAQYRAMVYALGSLGYDFGTEARRDTFKQLMAPVSLDGTVVPPNPYDARQMVDHLKSNPSEARSLIWTLNIELTPIYALEAVGSFASDIYAVLVRLLQGEVASEEDEDFIERVAVPGRLSGRSVKLFSGQIVPIVELEQVRGLYGWEVNKLISAAVSVASQHESSTADAQTVSRNLREFLAKVYYDLRNLGMMSRDRSLNFAATNAFQAAQTFSDALSVGMALDTIAVEKSPFCRLDSDCWDVRLRFFDPENNRRARRVYRFTIDVSDAMPVTLGEVRTWTEAA